ncbi:hypothetical protein AXF42_Ash010687 [Apostasia shenzhenica]|uniref:Uncharacterized protein n=1 Tax=Apostasia shenzhenica TaxID=1088818 RepID=A0A2I0A6T6_9ASPA|nr:hypothetical protein AXF42_Ash010687 [Apostasia shenzhenica]
MELQGRGVGGKRRWRSAGGGDEGKRPARPGKCMGGRLDRKDFRDGGQPEDEGGGSGGYGCWVLDIGSGRRGGWRRPADVFLQIAYSATARGWTGDGPPAAFCLNPPAVATTLTHTYIYTWKFPGSYLLVEIEEGDELHVEALALDLPPKIKLDELLLGGAEAEPRHDEVVLVLVVDGFCDQVSPDRLLAARYWKELLPSQLKM